MAVDILYRNGVRFGIGVGIIHQNQVSRTHPCIVHHFRFPKYQFFLRYFLRLFRQIFFHGGSFSGNRCACLRMFCIFTAVPGNLADGNAGYCQHQYGEQQKGTIGPVGFPVSVHGLFLPLTGSGVLLVVCGFIGGCPACFFSLTFGQRLCLGRGSTLPVLHGLSVYLQLPQFFRSQRGTVCPTGDVVCGAFGASLCSGRVLRPGSILTGSAVLFNRTTLSGRILSGSLFCLCYMKIGQKIIGFPVAWSVVCHQSIPAFRIVCTFHYKIFRGIFQCCFY